MTLTHQLIWELVHLATTSGANKHMGATLVAPYF
jgi:hypothetical protein